ncbi:hypothetical protein [Legionella sp. CNM-4043-24]|uniref:hypothetical protein n=1 Tax=Legionella sp. CNM-4043-24 TaxID=3421646 RepID=UPI00403AD27C
MKTKKQTRGIGIRLVSLIIVLICLILISVFFTKFDLAGIVARHSYALLTHLTGFALGFTCIAVILVLKEANLFFITRKNTWALFYIGIIGFIDLIGLIIPGLINSPTLHLALLIAANPLVCIVVTSMILKNPLRYARFFGITLSTCSLIIF